MARRRMDPTYGKYPIYEHCMPFDVSRAYDEARGVWVGPYKRLADLARFFLGPDQPERPRQPPVVVGIPTTKGRAFWSMRVDLVPKKKEP